MTLKIIHREDWAVRQGSACCQQSQHLVWHFYISNDFTFMFDDGPKCGSEHPPVYVFMNLEFRYKDQDTLNAF